MLAVYRMKVDAWDIGRAYREMKDYDFYTSWGHEAMKTYVFDYYRDLNNNRDANLKVSQVAAKDAVANK